MERTIENGTTLPINARGDEAGVALFQGRCLEPGEDHIVLTEEGAQELFVFLDEYLTERGL